MILHKPVSPDPGENEYSTVDSQQMALHQPMTDSVFPSSPPIYPTQARYYIDYPQLPTLMTTGKVDGQHDSARECESRSDPLAGPSTQIKGQASNENEGNWSTNYQQKKSIKNINHDNQTREDDMEVTYNNEEDDTDEIIAKAPRLDSSIYARSGPSIQPMSNAKDNESSKIHSTSDPQFTFSDRNQNFQSTSSDTVKDTLFKARDLIVKAYYISENRDEQSRLCDLLEIFREYTEKGLLSKASKIIATQVANLETATREIETRAKDLKNSEKPMTSMTQKYPHQTQMKTSMASVAKSNIEPTTGPQEWTVVGKKSSTQAKPTYPTKQNLRACKRVILVQDPDMTATVSPLQARNTINNAFAAKGVKGPVVNLVSKTNSGNISINMTDEYTSDFFLEKRDIWEKIIPHMTAQKDQPWFKVVAHGIPISDFNHDQGMDMIKDEITTFNKGLKPIGMPYWISTVENRLVKKAGSVAIAFATEEEASRAIRNRLYIAGISVRVSKFYTVAPTTQCSKCQGFGHLDNYCRKDPKCGLCGDEHSTVQHFCSVCKTKGKSCNHLAPKCVNCTGDHVSGSKSCQVFQSLKNKDSEVIN